jgi:hypothetical protein
MAEAENDVMNDDEESLLSLYNQKKKNILKLPCYCLF